MKITRTVSTKKEEPNTAEQSYHPILLISDNAFIPKGDFGQTLTVCLLN